MNQFSLSPDNMAFNRCRSIQKDLLDRILQETLTRTGKKTVSSQRYKILLLEMQCSWDFINYCVWSYLRSTRNEKKMHDTCDQDARSVRLDKILPDQEYAYHSTSMRRCEWFLLGRYDNWNENDKDRTSVVDKRYLLHEWYFNLNV